tara:strand:- start:1145 stop:1561 length:417 start_codon:yes stop_codon:yes gene_type:complete
MPTISLTTLAAYNGLVASTQTDYTGSHVVSYDSNVALTAGSTASIDFLVENSNNNIKFVLFQIDGDGGCDIVTLANSGSTTVMDLKSLAGGTVECGKAYQVIPNNNSGTSDIGHIRISLTSGSTNSTRRVRVTVLLDD